MNTYKVRHEFSNFKEFTTKLPEKFDQTGFVIHNGRNVIKKVSTPEAMLVVKNFKGMYFFNRLAYSLFRPSKAVRSYEYSKILNDKGILTPPHVAWVNTYKHGLLMRSYFVSVFYPYQTAEEAIQYYTIYDEAYKQSLLHALAGFAFKLHRLGIYHKDFSLGNILVIPKSDGYQFALIDLNRIKFRNVPYKEGLKNFITFRTNPEDVDVLIREYARLSGQPPEPSVRLFWKYENRRTYLRRLRKKIRRYTVKPLEKLLAQKHPR